MPGLGPGIHQAAASKIAIQTEPGRSVDRRAKPGDDETKRRASNRANQLEVLCQFGRTHTRIDLIFSSRSKTVGDWMSSGALTVLGFLIYFAAVAIPILSARTQKTLLRKPYAIRSSIVVAAMVAANLALEYEPTDFYDPDGSALALQIAWTAVLSIVDLFCTAILTLWSVHRLQHIGRSKWWCFLFVIPMAGLVLWIVLMVQQPRQPKAPSVTNENIPGPHPSL